MRPNSIGIAFQLSAAICAPFVAGVAQAHGSKHPAEAKPGYSKAEETPFGAAADPRKAARTVRVAAHIEMKALLSPEQIARYDELRGYAGGTSHRAGKH